jgi:hypothetical protein
MQRDSELLEQMKLMGRETLASLQVMETDRHMRCLSILRHLYHDPASTPFWAPPFGAPFWAPRAGKAKSGGRSTSVDLRAITTQLDGSENFEKEMALVWANCEAYGSKAHGPALKAAAAHCKALADILYRDWVKAPDRPHDPDLFCCLHCAFAE